MVAITATNSATPSLQSVLARAHLEQAQREANQAEANAHSLRTQADAAENDAQQSRQRVSNLGKISQQTDPTYQAQLQSSRSDMAPKSGYQATGRIVNLSA
jgi:hypothetical protein